MHIQVDSEHLHSTGDSFQAIVHDISTTIGNLNSAANSASGGWSGSSASAFNDLWRRLHGSLDHLNQAMGEIASNLHTAGTTYHETDSKMFTK
jgi:WXG100 family type VII secretion target